MQGQSQIGITAAQPATVKHGDEQLTLRPGAWSFRPDSVAPARQQFRLFIKTFKPGENDQAAAFVSQWKSQGYPAEIVPFGRRFRTESGKILDNRLLWISVNRFSTLAEAESAKHTLESQKVWGWIQNEVTQPGSGAVAIVNAAGAVAQRLRLPVVVQSPAAISIDNVEHGYGSSQRDTRSYLGLLEISAGPDGLLSLTEIVPLEDYIAGVLPSEMPAGWPVEALKAQAIAARSDTVANLSLKHTLEGYDFCATEHCKAYAGTGARKPMTDQAVAATKGEILTDGQRVAPTVFCANCGGWTENNETVWSSPPDPILRGVSDLEPGPRSAASGPANIARWLDPPPKAYCSGDDKTFRWSKRLTTGEITALVNKKYAVGTVRNIELGERGASGRLKWVRVVGSAKTETIQKELPIRLAFGGLPSAMFMVDRKAGTDGAPVFTFTGGGRGHGVGLCQQGARGRALEGQRYADILRRYFTGVTTERVR